MILVSSCLLGVNCRYNGGSCDSDKVRGWLKDKDYIIFCPEVDGGKLTSPRTPCERCGEMVCNRNGEDMTEAFRAGAEAALKLCQAHQADTALLKEQSPSCGVHRIYDGSFSGVKIPGMGLTAELLSAHGIQVISDEDL